MSKHTATIEWTANGPDFRKGQYSREHSWRFDGGAILQASPAPSVVPVPWSNPALIDPEEAYVASLSSCHMLTFLWLAGRAGYDIAHYQDTAVGEMRKNERGIPWVAVVTLQPRIEWIGQKQPDAAAIDRLHHAAHEQCFIANSVKTEIVILAPAGC